MSTQTGITSANYKINPDLQKERDTATFDVHKLTHILDGGPENTARRKRVEELVFSTPELDMSDRIFLSDEDKYDAALKKGVKLFRMAMEEGLGRDQAQIAARLIHYDLGIMVHGVMFLPTLESLATEEQQAEWLHKALTLQMIGTYAQTELGHGTNLQKLETRAVYDPAAQEFILSTPMKSSMKWWPGGLGKSANHAVVLATLYVKGQNCGMQPFLVQLRDMETHEPLPGIEVGSIGPTFGVKGADNGFLILHNVRVPRTNMLMKNAQVSPDGTFTRKGSSKANYGPMILVRANIVRWAYEGLSMSATIATRYSAVRRQSELKPGAQEPQVLDFQTQQHKLLPQIAAAYAIYFAGLYITETYNLCISEMQEGNVSNLPELHSQSSGLKALCTEIQMDGIEICRRSCGGHGYLLASGIPDIYTNSLAGVTVEGENTVLYLQVARHLMKTFAQAATGNTVPSSSAYLARDPGSCPINTAQDCQNLTLLIHAFQKRAYGKVKRMAQRVQAELSSGRPQYLVWNDNSVELAEAAKAHIDAFIVSNFVQHLQSLDADTAILTVLTTLCRLHATHRVAANAGEFLETEALNLDQLELIRAMELKLLSQVRPDAVALVDAFDWHDKTLNSAIGAYDGNAYDHLYEMAKRAPLNKKQVPSAFHKYVKPMHQLSKL